MWLKERVVKEKNKKKQKKEESNGNENENIKNEYKWIFSS